MLYTLPLKNFTAVILLLKFLPVVNSATIEQKNNISIKPEHIMKDSENKANLGNGIIGRKGSVAAFLKNIDILENPNISEEQKEEVIKTMKELAPVLAALDFLKYTTFKNPIVQKIIEDAYKKIK